MKLWIARDSENYLLLFDNKPEMARIDKITWNAEGNIYYISPSLFPEVTLENSPQQVEINLIK